MDGVHQSSDGCGRSLILIRAPVIHPDRPRLSIFRSDRPFADMILFPIRHAGSHTADIRTQKKPDGSCRTHLHTGCTSPAVSGDPDRGLLPRLPDEVSGAYLRASHTPDASFLIDSDAHTPPPLSSVPYGSSTASLCEKTFPLTSGRRTISNLPSRYLELT